VIQTAAHAEAGRSQEPLFGAATVTWWRRACIVAGLGISLILAILVTAAPGLFGALVVPFLLCGVIVAAAIWPSAYRPFLSMAPNPALPLLPVSLLAGLLGLVCALVGALQVGSHPLTAQDWWVAGMLIPLAGLVVPFLMRQSWRLGGSLSWRECAIGVGLLLLALAVRLPSITASPPFVHGDEAMGGIYGRMFDSGSLSLLTIGWHGLPMISYAVGGVSLRLFGNTLVGLRTGNALLGSLSVVVTYLLGRELFDRRAALLGATVLAVAFLDAAFSRSGLHDIQGPAWLTLVLYLVVRWIRRGGPLLALLSGLSMVLAVTMHWSARVGPILVLCLLIYIAVRERPLWQARWRDLPWLALGLLVGGLPVAGMFLADPGSIDARDAAISIFNPKVAAHLQSVYGSAALPVVLPNQLWRTIATFYVQGDASTLIDWQGGMFDTVSVALCAPAILLALRRARTWPYALCIGWIGSVMAASVLTIDPPWWPRLAALLPAVALCIGVLLSELVRHAQGVRFGRVPMAPLALAALLIPLVIGNLRILYVDYPGSITNTSTMTNTLVGRYLAGVPDVDNTVLLSDSGITLQAPAIRFLAPAAAGCTVGPGQPLTSCANAASASLFILLPGRAGDLPALQQQFPGGQVVDVGQVAPTAGMIIAYIPRRGA
jgi:4-amino-4-deoxy-L-arabinose transferase-like glycosyltransferase